MFFHKAESNAPASALAWYASGPRFSVMALPQVLPRDFFNLLRSQKGVGFEDFIRQRLIPIEGDMDKPLLGFSPELVAKLQDEVRID